MPLNDLKLFQKHSLKRLTEEKEKKYNKLFPSGYVSQASSWDQKTYTFVSDQSTIFLQFYNTKVCCKVLLKMFMS